MLATAQTIDRPPKPLVSHGAQSITPRPAKPHALEPLEPRAITVRAGRDEWFHPREEVDAWRAREKERTGRDLFVTDEAPVSNGHPDDSYREQEFHEVRKINKALEEMRAFGLQVSDLLPHLGPTLEPLLRRVLDTGRPAVGLEIRPKPNIRVTSRKVAGQRPMFWTASW